MSIVQKKVSRSEERGKRLKSKQEELDLEQELLKREIERRTHESKEKRRMRRKMQREKMLANLHQKD